MSSQVTQIVQNTVSILPKHGFPFRKSRATIFASVQTQFVFYVLDFKSSHKRKALYSSPSSVFFYNFIFQFSFFILIRYFKPSVEPLDIKEINENNVIIGNRPSVYCIKFLVSWQFMFYFNVIIQGSSMTGYF